jgi:4-amino-4-deoxy-L-arabinose transferase-like glycosyltransferase
MTAIPAETSAYRLPRIDRWAAAWRGPLISGLLVFVTALPGLLVLPPLDRDESRFAQATAQMLETGDFVNIRYQDAPRDKKPVGIHWLQAASVSLLSSVEKREIWAYRIPSLLGAAIAAAACAWGAAAFFGARGGLFAGLVMGSTLLISSEAFIAKTDAVLCGAITLSMAALGHLYLAAREGRPMGFWPKLLFWAGLSTSILVKGPIGPMVAGLALVALGVADRGGRWIGRIGWIWGLLLVLAVVGPWAIAITVSTDGRFWTGSVGGDLAPKLAGGHETHGAPPGLHALLAPLLFFPSTAALPAAAVVAWRRRLEPGVRFALAWLVLSWLVFEAAPTKLWHYTEPLYGALAWLAAAALIAPAPWGPWARRAGVALSLLAGTVLATAAVYLARRYGAGGSPWMGIAAALALATGVTGAIASTRAEPWRLGVVALGLGVSTHIALTAGLAPALKDLWLSRDAAQLLAARGLDPRNGVTEGPVAVVGYGEPSLVFLLETELDTPVEGADALASGEPVLVENKQAPAFQQALESEGAPGIMVGTVRGFDYSIGKPTTLRLYRSAAPPEGQRPSAVPATPKGVATPVKTASRPAT